MNYPRNFNSSIVSVVILVLLLLALYYSPKNCNPRQWNTFVSGNSALVSVPRHVIGVGKSNVYTKGCIGSCVLWILKSNIFGSRKFGATFIGQIVPTEIGNIEISRLHELMDLYPDEILNQYYSV